VFNHLVADYVFVIYSTKL